MSVDVIVTTYNRVDLFKRTMESFFANTDLDLIGKIIVSNDGSIDATADYISDLKKQFPNKIVVLPEQTERKGLVTRFNAALALCESNVICEFQDDVEFTSKWLEVQMGYLDMAHFVTGFNAPEHKVFARGKGYVIKHSSRFTQLLARRSSWEQWFPMAESYSFPTPTFKSGRQIGSNIDANLYNKRKNNPRGETKFLVIPGLIKHNAENSGSTWRPPSEPTKHFGGLREEEVKSYWYRRYHKQQSIAVGFAGKPSDEQEAILAEKKAFILPQIDTSLHVIDYGCGVGHFSKCFDPTKYTGCDITEQFLMVAQKNNPGYYYACLDKPFFDIDFRQFDMFFTTNVLQHNSDEVVEKLFFCLSMIKKKGFVFALYENTHNYTDTGHMRFRKAEDYITMISKFFVVKSSSSTSHVVHGEQHSLIKVYV